jgi:SPP1 gp7 family putative phage head morphogenesis protein
LSETADALTDTFGGFIDRGRAQTIARTETTASYNQATQSAWEQSDLVESKEWLTIMDGNQRDSHGSLDGTRVAMDEKFPNGLLYPGDPNGPAKEVVNCRCNMIASGLAPNEAPGVLEEIQRSWTVRAGLLETLKAKGNGKPSRVLAGTR